MDDDANSGGEEQTMTRRAYGGATLTVLTSGPIILGRSSKDHTIAHGHMVEEFKRTDAEVVKTRPWGNYIKVSGWFEENVTNEPVTVSFNWENRGRDRETITQKTFTVSGKTFSKTFRLWHLPDIAVFSRDES